MTKNKRNANPEFIRKAEEWLEAYIDWLGQYWWQWFVTLTFPGYPGGKKAEKKFDVWKSQLQSEIGAEDFRFVRVMERGAYGDNVHFHCVFGGLNLSGRNLLRAWEKRWADITGGEASIQHYDANQAGIRYMLKSLRPDEDPAIELQLPEADKPGSEADTGQDEGEGERALPPKSYDAVLHYVRSTPGTHVYGNGVLTGQYLPKSVVGEKPPASVRFRLEWNNTALVAVQEKKTKKRRVRSIAGKSGA